MMEAQEVDLFRDTPVRLLGYANEVGEAFRPVLPRFVVPSYGIAIGYVVADTAHKSMFLGKEMSKKEQVVAAVDTLCWQMLASVIIPGFTINRVVWGSGKLIQQRLGPTMARYGPVGIGLSTIPFIVQPIDDFVHHLMDNTLRKHF